MRKGIGEDGKVVAVIGDGALTGGVAYEALHQAGGLQTPMVIVLNDNGMSISPNVGALSRYFQRARLNPRLYHAREGVEERLTKLPLGLGRRIERLGPEIKSAIKAYWAPGAAVRGARPRLHGRRSTATTSARCAARSTRRSPPTARSSSTSTRSRARASSPPRRAASRAWRSGTPPSPARSSTASRRRRSRRSPSRSRSRSRTRRPRSRPRSSRSRRRSRPARSTRPSSPTPSWPRPSATSG